MATIQMETSPQVQTVRQPSAASPLGALDITAVDPTVGHSIEQVREEVDEVFKDARSFYNREPDEVMRLIAGHSARLAELRVRIHRVENIQRQWQAVRTREIEPAMDELQKQFQLASRLLTVRELDFKMETGSR